MKHTYLAAKSKQPLTSGHTHPALLFRFPEYQHLLRSFHDHSVPQQKHSTRWLHSNICKNMTHKNNWVSFHLIIWTSTTWVSLSVSPLLAESLNHRHITMSKSILPRVLPQHHLTRVDATLGPLSSTVLISFHCCDFIYISVRKNKKWLILFMISEASAHVSWPVSKQGSMKERMVPRSKASQIKKRKRRDRSSEGHDENLLLLAGPSYGFLHFPILLSNDE